MVCPWFTTPWRPVSQSHRAGGWRFRPLFPSQVPFPLATSCEGPNPRVPWFPDPERPLCDPCYNSVLPPCPLPIPHPVFLPHRAASNPVARAHRTLIHPETVSCSLHGSLLLNPLLPRTRRVLLRLFLFGASGPVCLPVYWHEKTACPGGCVPAGTPLRSPPLGLGGEVCSVFCMLQPHVVLPPLRPSCRPRMAVCLPDVGPSPLMGEGPFFCYSPHTSLGRAAVCVICALNHAGWTAHLFQLCLGTARFFLFYGCGLAGTPLHVPLLGLGQKESSVVVRRLCCGVHVDALIVVCVSPPLV